MFRAGVMLLLSVAVMWASRPTAAVGSPAAGPSPTNFEVNFPHQDHVEVLEIECRECHHETDAKLLDIPHQEYFRDFWIDCATCHHVSRTPREPTSCSTCHHQGVDCADETLSAKVVIHASCWRCHEVGTGREASAACGHCHRGAADRG